VPLFVEFALGCTLCDRGRLSARLIAAPAIAALIIGMLVLAGVNDRIERSTHARPARRLCVGSSRHVAIGSS